MSKAKPPKTALPDRERELEDEIRAYDTFAKDAKDANQLGASVAAMTQASKLRRELSDLRAELAAASLDPVAKLESLRQRAAAAGSWTSAAQLEKQVEEARARAEAERKRKEEEANKDPNRLKDKLRTALSNMPAAMRDELLAPYMPR